MKEFDCPLGLRLRPQTFPARKLRLKEGYNYSPLENSSDSFRISVVAGVAKVAELFCSFARHLPEETFFILEFYQEEDAGEKNVGDGLVPTVCYSPYLQTTEILEIIESYLPRLIHDGFVGFGLANNREGLEVFYSEEKVLTFFTGNHLRVMNFLAENGVPYRPRLLLPTDMHHDHFSLQCHHRNALPEPFASMSEMELDYVQFCNELIEHLDMYPIEENLSFFLSKREQDLIEDLLRQNLEFHEFLEDDFGSLLLDWNDFVNECEAAFEGDLWEYRLGLQLRDMIQYVIENVPEHLSAKLLDIVREADGRFRQILVDHRKRLDMPGKISEREERFWYRGVIRNQGVCLRRDLIRQGWFKP